MAAALPANLASATATATALAGDLRVAKNLSSQTPRKASSPGSGIGPPGTAGRLVAHEGV
jgi:hypothetical protein